MKHPVENKSIFNLKILFLWLNDENKTKQWKYYKKLTSIALKSLFSSSFSLFINSNTSLGAMAFIYDSHQKRKQKMIGNNDE